jgi:ureidoglycolate hydrolase
MSTRRPLLEIETYSEEGYHPLVDYGAWRVAMLRYHPELLPQNITDMQKHDETDEIFVLLAGHCILFVADGEAEPGSIQAHDMQALKVYNVKRSVWHTHTLSLDASVLIVENRDTVLENSPKYPISEAQRESLVKLTEKAWGQVK